MDERDPRWHLGQCLVWIGTHYVDTVALVADGNFLGWRAWLDHAANGEIQGPPTSSGKSPWQPPLLNIEQAWYDLVAKLNRGVLEATGIPRGDLVPRKIKPEEYHGIKIGFAAVGPAAPHLWSKRPFGIRFEDVRILKDDVIDGFPAPAAEDVPAKRCGEAENRITAPPQTTGDCIQETAVNAQSLLRQRRARIAGWFNRRQERTAFEKRIWLSLSEIADEYARKPRSLAVDDEQRGRALDALRHSILAHEFVDYQGRSRILNMHQSGLADFRFDPLGARHADLFNPIVQHLWMKYQDCVNWFNRHGVDLPLRLRRGSSSMAWSEATRADIEPPAPPKRSELAKTSDKNKEPDVIEIAKTFVEDGIAPSVREHTTLVMSVLKKEYPGNHPKRAEVAELLTVAFMAQRRSRGRASRPR